MNRLAAVLAVLILTSTVAPVPSAHAVTPPRVLPGPPPTGPVAPPTPTEQRASCGMPTVLPGSQFGIAPAAEAILSYRRASAFSRGQGQRVALIDTGVAPNPRLRALQPGGDYVSGTDGLVDCDGHGTLLAGLIAATAVPEDAFSGVAPDAAIISIRQNSAAYSAPGAGARQDDPNAVSPGYGDTRTLALAIARAVDLGATVITLTEWACAPADSGLDDVGVGQALVYAHDRDVLVVAAAGDLSDHGGCGRQNEVQDPNLPLADAWRTVQTTVSPAWFADYVLTVAAVNPNGTPADFSVHGPWVDVAAPGAMITSLNPAGQGLVNGWLDPQHGPTALAGTAFAAALVSGVAALVRARFPTLSAEQVIDRIKRTAHTPDAGPNAATGYGVVDPVTALTAQLPLTGVTRVGTGAVPLPTATNPPSPPGRTLVLAIVAVSAALAAIAVISASVLAERRRRRDPEGRLR